MKVSSYAKKVQDQIAAEFVEAIGGIEESTWKKTWKVLGQTLPTSVSSGKAYQGINFLYLSLIAGKRGYTSKHWGTFKSWQNVGGTLKDAKGQGVPIVFWQIVEKEDKHGNKETFPIYRVSTVFNADLVEGWEPPVENTPELNDNERIEAVEAALGELQATVNHGGDKAFWSPSTDNIGMPLLEQFDSTEHYYATLLHEYVHWTGAKHRLNRSELSYGFEELVAELGSAFLCAHFGIEQASVRESHIQYLKGWCDNIRKDSKVLFDASRYAQKAFQYITDRKVRINTKAA